MAGPRQRPLLPAPAPVAATPWIEHCMLGHSSASAVLGPRPLGAGQDRRERVRGRPHVCEARVQRCQAQAQDVGRAEVAHDAPRRQRLRAQPRRPPSAARRAHRARRAAGIRALCMTASRKVRHTRHARGQDEGHPVASVLRGAPARCRTPLGARSTAGCRAARGRPARPGSGRATTAPAAPRARPAARPAPRIWRARPPWAPPPPGPRPPGEGWQAVLEHLLAGNNAAACSSHGRIRIGLASLAGACFGSFAHALAASGACCGSFAGACFPAPLGRRWGSNLVAPAAGRLSSTSTRSWPPTHIP